MLSRPFTLVCTVLQKRTRHKEHGEYVTAFAVCLPAALLLRTALLVYREAHTPARAFSSAPEVARATFGILSYSPAPDMPARSSTLAELLTITVASAPNALPACPNTLSSSEGGRPRGNAGAGKCSKVIGKGSGNDWEEDVGCWGQ